MANQLYHDRYGKGIIIIIINDYCVDLKKSMCHNITSVSMEGEGKDTVSNINSPIIAIIKLKILKKSLPTYWHSQQKGIKVMLMTTSFLLRQTVDNSKKFVH